MDTRRIFIGQFLSLAVAGVAMVAFAIAGCSANAPAHTHAARTAAPAATSSPTTASYSPVCPYLMPGVRKMARDLHIDLLTGTWNASLNFSLVNMARWMADESSGGVRKWMWRHPSAATRTLRHDNVAALFALPKAAESNSDAEVFVMDLQTVASDCGQS